MSMTFASRISVPTSTLRRYRFQPGLMLLVLASLVPDARGQSGIVRFKQAELTVSEGTGIALVELERTGNDAGTAITFQTVAETAQAGVDFHPIAETYSFANGEATVALAVQVFDNTQFQSNRQLRLELSNPVNLNLGQPSTITLVIADNDTPESPGRGAAGTNIFQGVYAVATNSSGAVMAGGLFRTFDGELRNHLARLLPTGELDLSFQTGSGPDHQVWALAVQADDRILLAGDFQTVAGTSRRGIARLLDSGAVDPAFATGTGTDGRVESIELQANGQILIGGRFGEYNGVTRTDVALLNTDGSLDQTFNAVTPSSFFGDTARRHGDHILVGGFVAGPGADVRDSLMRFDLTGVRDSAFQPSIGDIFFNQVYELVVQPDQKIVICGSFLGVNGTPSSGVARLNADGTTDETFDVGTGANDTVIRIRRQSDGRLIAAGVFTSFDGIARPGVVRLEANGEVDTSFNPGTGADDFAYTALPLADGGVLVGGAFNRFDGFDRFRLAWLNADGSVSVRPPEFTQTTLPGGDDFRMVFTVEPGRPFRLLVSSTLDNWISTQTNRTARSGFEITLPSVLPPTQFFQLEQPVPGL